MARQFHLGDILSSTTSMLVSPTHMDGIYSIQGYVDGCIAPDVDEVSR